ncbi:MAG: hypothetical protein ACP5OO_02665 [Chloroflexia bacterium]
MRTHVFIVNNDTFPIHLQYLFAGTGAGNQDSHVGLLSDIKRVRVGDLVLFYIEAPPREKGGFYGIFKVADQQPLVFHVQGQGAMQPNLRKKLIYRTLIEPYEVYSEGVLEWEALDKLPVYATEVQWSLIYRKLRGKRGCTPILPWEAQRLTDMIRDKNRGVPIADPRFTGVLQWDPSSRRITPGQATRQSYPYPRNFNFNVLKEICDRQRAYNQKQISLPILYFEFTVSCGSRIDFCKIDYSTPGLPLFSGKKPA